MIRFLLLSLCLFLIFHHKSFAGEWQKNPAYKNINQALINEARGIVPPDELIRSGEDHSRYYEKSLRSVLNKLRLKETTKIEDRYIYAFSLLELINIREQREKNTSALKKQLDFLEEYLSTLEKDSEKAENKLRSDIFRIIADVNNKLAPYHGFKEMMDFFAKSELYLKKSLDLNKRNSRAIKSLALSYYFKPRIAGGSVKQSIRLLNEAVGYSKDVPKVRYELYIWLSSAYARQKKAEKAKAAIEKALAIYPAGGFANYVLELVEDGKYIK